MDEQKTIVAGTFERTVAAPSASSQREIVQFKLTHESVAGIQGETQTETRSDGTCQTKSSGTGPKGSWTYNSDKGADGSMSWTVEEKSSDGQLKRSKGSISSAGRIDGIIDQSDGTHIEYQDSPGGLGRCECSVPDYGKVISEVARSDGKVVTTVTHPNGVIERSTVVTDASGKGQLTLPDGTVHKME